MMQLLLSLLLAVTTGEPPQAVVTLLDGGTATGRLETWDGRQIAVRTDAGVKEFDSEALLDVRWTREGSPVSTSTHAHIELVDGTKIPYAEFTVLKRLARIVTPLAESPLEIRTDLIRRVELHPPSEATDAAWDEIDRKELDGDMLLLVKREGESVDNLSGVVGDVTADQAEFEWDGERLEVKRSKIAGIVFYEAKARALPEAICELSTADDSRIPVRRISLANDMATVTTPAGAELQVAVGDLRRADFSLGKLAYLSDLTPSQVTWEARIAPPAGAQLIGAQGQPRSNESFTGSPLSLLWKDDPLPSRREVRTYNKGLAIRSRTEMTYRLPADMRRFAAIAGIDPLSASQGHVVLEIRADDQVVWEGEIDGKRQPVEIDVELGTARRLHLTVDYGNNLDYGDRLHLVEARVTK